MHPIITGIMLCIQISILGLFVTSLRNYLFGISEIFLMSICKCSQHMITAIHTLQKCLRKFCAIMIPSCTLLKHRRIDTPYPVLIIKSYVLLITPYLVLPIEPLLVTLLKLCFINFIYYISCNWLHCDL